MTKAELLKAIDNMKDEEVIIVRTEYIDDRDGWTEQEVRYTLNESLQEVEYDRYRYIYDGGRLARKERVEA